MIRTTLKPSLRLFGAAMLCAFAISAVGAPALADGRHRHRHGHHSHRHHSHRVVDISARSSAGGGLFSGSGSSLITEARRYLGGNPTGMPRLWCARFMNMVLKRTGHKGTGSDAARSFANYGKPVSGPRVGAIAVMSRGKNGGHVGVVSGIDQSGNPIIISGNHNRRVAEAVYPRGRIYAYVMPN